MSETAAALALADVRSGYGETVVINGLTLSLAPGETLALLGRNGVGKTTLLATIMGRARLHSGSIRFAGREIGSLPINRRNALGIALVPQEREIFRSLTVEDNLRVSERASNAANGWTSARVYDYFPRLAERHRNRGDQLSGGEQQMLSLGRALMGNPSLLLLDEPLEGLAPVIVEQLFAGLKKLRDVEGLTMVLVEQHAHLAMEFAPRTVVLDRGAVVYDGASRDLAQSPERMAALLGVDRH